MAYTAQDDTLLDPNKQNQQGQQGGQAGGATPNTGGSGQDPFAGSQGVSTAGVGSGGQGGWTNIQAYLNANQGNTGSQDALNKQVGGQFDQEQKSFDDSSSGAKQKAQSEMDRSNMGQDQASKLVGDASNLYSYGNQPQAASSGADPYKAIMDQFGQARQAYQGPQSFTYAPDSYAKTQNYGSNLGTDQGFNALMGGIYNQSAGGQMNSGQQALQTQLDTNNPGLQQARQNLMNRYSGLSSGIQQGTQDTDQFVKNAAGTVGTNQSNLDQYLGGLATTNRNQLDRRVSGANSAMNDFGRILHTNLERSVNAPDDGRSNVAVQVTPAMLADEKNIAGADQQRNSWNVIQDILNRQDQKINPATQMFDPHSAQFNISGLPPENENGVKTLDQIKSDPFFQGLYDPSIIDNYFDPMSGVSGGLVGRRI